MRDKGIKEFCLTNAAISDQLSQATAAKAAGWLCVFVLEYKEINPIQEDRITVCRFFSPLQLELTHVLCFHQKLQGGKAFLHHKSEV